jgi:hypothetical protein
LGDFEENAQEPTMRFNIQPATQTTEFSDFQLKPVLAPSDLPTVLFHEPTLSLSATPTASAGSMVKVSLLSPLSSV